MRSSSLNSKTIRPGLASYSFYSSSRRPAGRRTVTKAQAKRKRRRGLILSLLTIAAVCFGLVVAERSYRAYEQNASKPVAATTQQNLPKPKPAAPAAAAPVAAAAVAPSQCAGNSLNQLIIVSISDRHLWACQYQNVVYDSPVVTGMAFLAADLTPTGTYHIYSKQTNVTLRGSDTTGSWSDYVHYWMPFLSNQYGIYGFHDATWRPDSAFGNISPYSSDASHGCVEMPLATAAWLYNWAQIGTTATIKA